MSEIEQKLKELGLSLQDAQKPIAKYVPVKIINKTIYVSGQLPMQDGKVKVCGLVGMEVSIEEAKLAAKICILNALSQIKLAIGNLDKLQGCSKLGIYVNTSADFQEHPEIGNGASELLYQILPNGEHTRTTIGVSSLPKKASVEIDAIFELL